MERLLSRQGEEIDASGVAIPRACRSDLKMALLLRDVAGLSYTEIADSLEITLATVKWRIYKGRERVALALAARGSPSDAVPPVKAYSSSPARNSQRQRLLLQAGRDSRCRSPRRIAAWIRRAARRAPRREPNRVGQHRQPLPAASGEDEPALVLP
jgi:hypothetical protein